MSATARLADLLTQSLSRWSTLPPSVMPDPTLVKMLVKCFVAAEPAVEQIVARGSYTLGKRWRWLQPLAQRYIKAFADRTRPRQREVVRFLLHDRGFQRAWLKHSHELSINQWLSEPQRMQPVAAAATWDVPRIESVGELAEWLRLEAGELQWFADLKGLGYRKSRPQLNHYLPNTGEGERQPSID